MISVADVNGDGKVDFKEFLKQFLEEEDEKVSHSKKNIEEN